MIRRLCPNNFESPAFRQLLWLAVEQSDSELDRIVREDLPNLCVYGAEDGRVLKGFVAFEMGDEIVTIEYVAVAEDVQHLGIGTALLGAVAEAAPGRVTYAQTDDDAVGFYRRSGFTVEVGSIDRRWPDRVRDDCRRSPRLKPPTQ